MTHVFTVILNFTRTDEGQDLLEYALLMSLIAVAAVLSVTQLGQTITNIFWKPIGALSI